MANYSSGKKGTKEEKQKSLKEIDIISAMVVMDNINNNYRKSRYNPEIGEIFVKKSIIKEKKGKQQ